MSEPANWTRDWVGYDSNMFTLQARKIGCFYLYEIKLDRSHQNTWQNPNPGRWEYQTIAYIKALMRRQYGMENEQWCLAKPNWQECRVDLFTTDEQWIIEALLIGDWLANSVLSRVKLAVERDRSW